MAEFSIEVLAPQSAAALPDRFNAIDWRGPGLLFGIRARITAVDGLFQQHRVIMCTGSRNRYFARRGERRKPFQPFCGAR